jgi:hypothetical protein
LPHAIPHAEETHAQTVPARSPPKDQGLIGETLEGDAYLFKLVSIGPCGNAPNAAPDDPKGRVVIGAEVEITATKKVVTTPRHVSLGKDGITFFGDVNQKRVVKGCTPVLKVGHLGKGDVAKGFVLFDVPTAGPGSNCKELNLVYLPARFGGASQVLVRLQGT